METDTIESKVEEGSGDQELDKTISDALAQLSLTTERDSALLDHLNRMDKYMFHMECLSQQFRMVL